MRRLAGEVGEEVGEGVWSASGSERTKGDVSAMRRGQSSREDLYGEGSSDPEAGWTKQVLVDTGGISMKSFDTIRKAARVKGPPHGGLDWVFNAQDLITLIKKAECGTFSERGRPAAKQWRLLLAERGLVIPGEDPRKR